jgi:hypothetical protein
LQRWRTLPAVGDTLDARSRPPPGHRWNLWWRLELSIMGSREDEFYSRTQAELDQLEETRDHWYWRPGWRVGRSFYTWHLTFQNAAEVAALAAYYQQQMPLPSLDPVPAEGLHMTLQGVGFTDEVTDTDIQAITDHARERCSALEPFALTLGPARGDAQGVGFPDRALGAGRAAAPRPPCSHRRHLGRRPGPRRRSRLLPARHGLLQQHRDRPHADA